MSQEINDNPTHTWNELKQDFPQSSGYFGNQENYSALIYNDRRLLYADEKIALMGGEEEVRRSLSELPEKDAKFVAILKACSITPATIRIIEDFCLQAGVVNEENQYVIFHDVLRTSYAIPKLIEAKSPIWHLGRFDLDPPTFKVSQHKRAAFSTTEQGSRAQTLKQIAEASAGKYGFIKGLIPGFGRS